MKALEILKSHRAGNSVWFTDSWARNRYYDEAIEELESLQSNYDEIQQELSDANEAYLVLLRQYHETQSIIKEQEKRLNEYADMIYEESKPKTCDGCKWEHNKVHSPYCGISDTHKCSRIYRDYYEPKEL